MKVIAVQRVQRPLLTGRRVQQNILLSRHSGIDLARRTWIHGPIPIWRTEVDRCCHISVSSGTLRESLGCSLHMVIQCLLQKKTLALSTQQTAQADLPRTEPNMVYARCRKGLKCEYSTRHQIQERFRHHPRGYMDVRGLLNMVSTLLSMFVGRLTSDLIVRTRVILVNVHKSSQTKQINIKHVGKLLYHGPKLHSNLNPITLNSSDGGGLRQADMEQVQECQSSPDQLVEAHGWKLIFCNEVRELALRWTKACYQMIGKSRTRRRWPSFYCEIEAQTRA